ncbi:hypothetical protein ZYGR_0U01290 [Zygosaccharomyces rouxii]|uniref:Small ribosomal subunit protein mS38 n=1 Tax=Zygosaccharomyces rouxii TaxID=4956 RepID=A0A1Q3A3S4_ZYGRO|nr:hypothetical protein LQ764DRAFT_231182 [Zygosaccharomyces rouxii]GAV50273.1 hypothetical protein ZYGR_0U01290 [Zygosaccharomyces rouxii]
MFLCSIRRLPRLALRPLSTLTSCSVGTPKPFLPSMLMQNTQLNPVNPLKLQLQPQFEPLQEPVNNGDVRMELDSVMRKRRKKMKKHKLRKRRKREKAEKRKLTQGR